MDGEASKVIEKGVKSNRREVNRTKQQIWATNLQLFGV